MKEPVATSTHWTLVTGASGFLGSHVVDHCLRLGHNVIALDNFSNGSRANIPVGAKIVDADVRDARRLSQLFGRYKIKFVYHLAAFAAEGLSHHARHFTYDNNVIGSALLINESVKSGVKCFVFTSSIAIYGHTTEPIHEDAIARPIDPYGISKFTTEQDLDAAREYFGLNYIIFRPHNIYGLRQNMDDPFRNVVGIFMKQALSQTPLTIFGDGSQKRAFTYVDDIAPIISKAAERQEIYNSVFNLGNDQLYTVSHLANLVLTAIGSSSEIRHVESRAEVHVAQSDHSNSRRIFGDYATTPLEVGIGRMAKWAKIRCKKANTKPFSVEIPKNVPSPWLSSLA